MVSGVPSIGSAITASACVLGGASQADQQDSISQCSHGDIASSASDICANIAMSISALDVPVFVFSVRG